MVRCYFWIVCLFGFFTGARYLLMRTWSYLGVGSGKQEKLTGSGTELFRGSRYWGVVMRLPNLKGRIFSGGGKNTAFQPLDVCLLDGSFPEQRKMIQMMRLPNMMVSSTQVLGAKCFWCCLSYMKRRFFFSVSQLKLYPLKKMGGMFIYLTNNIKYSYDLNKISLRFENK